MAPARTYSVALVGVRGHLIEVEADITSGLPATIVAGLPDTARREARDRIRAAIINSGERWPDSKITVTLSPVSLPKRGSASDLAIAIAILAANGDLPELAGNLLFLAELGLDGRLRPVAGVLPEHGGRRGRTSHGRRRGRQPRGGIAGAWDHLDRG